jgi:hypothetical protein
MGASRTLRVSVRERRTNNEREREEVGVGGRGEGQIAFLLFVRGRWIFWFFCSDELIGAN